MIVLTNDDGIFSPGIRSLAKSLRSAGMDVVIVAPSQERSGSGMSITLSKSVEYVKINLDGHQAYSVRGTPADCVLFSLNILFPDEIDAVVSGTNAGINAGYGIIFNSGTMSAALLASMLGLPSFAFSQYVTVENRNSFETYENGAKVAARIVLDFLNSSKRVVGMINVNFPDKVDENTGIVEVPFSRYPLYRKKIIFNYRTEKMGSFRILPVQEIPETSSRIDDISAVLHSGLISMTKIPITGETVNGPENEILTGEEL
ncbi:MAG: 5'/3'-nucleotidase SurE [Thermoplasmataceae archaeon]